MDFDYKDEDNEFKSFQEKINKLEIENERMKEVLLENGLEDEVPDVDCISVEEKICVNGIKHISQRVELDDFDDKDVKNFEVLHRTLGQIRGRKGSSKSKKKMTTGELISIVKGAK